MQIPYEIEERDTKMAQLAADEKAIVEDVNINLDENERPTNCYFVVIDATEPQLDLLAEADMTILNLTQQLILAQEGLT